MTRACLLLLWLAAPALADGPRLKPGEQAITIDGLVVHLSAPASIRAKQPHPLLVFLHGAGGKADAHRTWLRQQLGGRRWLIACPQGPNRQTTHDGLRIGRYRKLVDALSRRASIDPRRIYLAGHSDGCTFGFYLLGELPGLFCAFAGINGMLLGADEARLKAGAPAICFSVGKRDMYAQRYRAAVNRLRGLGLLVTEEQPDLGHALAPTTIRRLAGWLGSQRRPEAAEPLADRPIDQPLAADATFVQRDAYASSQLDRARVLLRAMRIGEARTLLRQLVAEHPDSDAAASARQLLGRIR